MEVNTSKNTSSRGSTPDITYLISTGPATPAAARPEDPEPKPSTTPSTPHSLKRKALFQETYISNITDTDSDSDSGTNRSIEHNPKKQKLSAISSISNQFRNIDKLESFQVTGTETENTTPASNAQKSSQGAPADLSLLFISSTVTATMFTPRKRSKANDVNVASLSPTSSFATNLVQKAHNKETYQAENLSPNSSEFESNLDHIPSTSHLDDPSCDIPSIYSSPPKQNISTPRVQTETGDSGHLTNQTQPDFPIFVDSASLLDLESLSHSPAHTGNGITTSTNIPQSMTEPYESLPDSSNHILTETNSVASASTLAPVPKLPSDKSKSRGKIRNKGKNQRNRDGDLTANMDRIIDQGADALMEVLITTKLKAERAVRTRLVAPEQEIEIQREKMTSMNKDTDENENDTIIMTRRLEEELCAQVENVHQSPVLTMSLLPVESVEELAPAGTSPLPRPAPISAPGSPILSQPLPSSPPTCTSPLRFPPPQPINTPPPLPLCPSIQIPYPSQPPDPNMALQRTHALELKLALHERTLELSALRDQLHIRKRNECWMFTRVKTLEGAVAVLKEEKMVREQEREMLNAVIRSPKGNGGKKGERRENGDGIHGKERERGEGKERKREEVREARERKGGRADGLQRWQGRDMDIAW